MKKVVIVHGWDFNPAMNWYPWLKRELEKKGFEVLVPEMPNTSEPVIADWVAHLKKTVNKIDSDTYFIGHSIGCQTIMRYIQTLPEQTRIENVAFVAGWLKLENLEGEEVTAIAQHWLETPIDFSKVKKKISKLTVFLSNNDPYDCLSENAQTFREKLGAKVIILSNKGHFTQDDGVLEVPEVLKEIVKS